MSQPDWTKLTFGLQDTAPFMYVARWKATTGWVKEGCIPYGTIAMEPAAQVLNYGQALFEGMKALSSSKDRTVLFRPRENAKRMGNGAQRMCMADLPEEVFLEGVHELVKANNHYVPPLGMGSMYLRPLLLGTGPTLGLASAPEVTFVIYSAAVGSYFAGGAITPIHLKVEQAFHRAAPRGVGAAKCAGNYGAGLMALQAAKKAGFTDVVYLDAKTDTCLEELSAANIFVVKGKCIKTPPLQGTILPGVTRESVLKMATDKGYTVEEVAVTVEEALAADEVFTSGTAVVLCPVGSLTYNGDKTTFGSGTEPGPVCLDLYKSLTDLQTEQAEDTYGWVVPLDDMGSLYTPHTPKPSV